MLISKLISFAQPPKAPELQRPMRPAFPMDALIALERRSDVVARSAAGLVEDQVARFLEPTHHGEHLRLPPPPPADGPEVRGAVARILAAGRTEVKASSEQLGAEAEMLRVLSGYRAVIEEILRRSQAGHERSSTTRPGDQQRQ